jgi:hypothetical protein
MKNQETLSCLAPGHSLWSHHRKRSEGSSAGKLHCRVSHFRSLKATHNRRSRYAKSRNHFMFSI